MQLQPQRAVGLLLSIVWAGDIDWQWHPPAAVPQHTAEQQIRAVSRLQLT